MNWMYLLKKLFVSLMQFLHIRGIMGFVELFEQMFSDIAHVMRSILILVKRYNNSNDIIAKYNGCHDDSILLVN